MSYDPNKHHRRSIRLKGYDYAQPGAYFVTICTQDQESLFGDIVIGQMHLNAVGEMVWRWWRELNQKYPMVQTDAAVVMPNHFHGIIIVGQPPGGQPPRVAPTDVDAAPVGATLGGRPDAAPTLGQIVGWFKTMATNEYIRGVKQQGWPPFPGRVWQRNYYEHIVRSEVTLRRIRTYIQNNPQLHPSHDPQTAFAPY